VPYLVEREGTNNENLPETHEILKRIRAEVDKYPDRMLLAEANQWPEDTQAYFGQGDECHMAFNFPLMPRMYMAIAQEDRFPIADILRQTPDIPEHCQWAIFLRNHDELTLEMVTDKERDYLWEVYASDRRARLNLGIRRRLAPLLERDRRRIELMNCLLLTMPGTPVVYYGDEIGMGDNLHLGDRDGVRTPMQWSSDRNGGFSRADPASLVLPAIMDPLYGFGAVNVEAQWRDPHSLLNWFRRMLVERRKHKAFGRGTMRLLRPLNRKVLAYLREFEGETILCVANVSRSAQAVELELPEFAGRTPVELLGGAAFPKLGQLTYLLTLPPYGFYWFQLSAEAAPPVWSTATPGPMLEYHTFVLRRELAEIGDAPARATFEREVLPPYIRQRRWFQGKDRRIEAIEVAMLARLPHPRNDLLYTEIRVSTGETVDHYSLPLSIAWDGDLLKPFEAPLALARVRQGRRVGFLTDGFASTAFTQAIIEGLRSATRVPIGDGELIFKPTQALAGLALAPDAEIEWPGAEQSNSTLAIDRKAVIKLFRRLTPGTHPEAEMSRVLTERGFTGTPPLLGEVVRIDGEKRAATVVLAQGFVANQGDGWQWTLDQLDRIVDEGATPYPPADETAFEPFIPFARVVGRRIGEMHAILAQPSDDPAFAVETAGARQVRDTGRRIAAQLDRALKALSGAALAGNEAALVASLKARRDVIRARIEDLVENLNGATLTRIHGDLHLGQILVAGADVSIIDFEGEPAKTLDERRAKYSPLRDVAGMIRSFDYAASSVERTTRQAEAGQGAARAEALLARFRDVAVKALLECYQEGRGAPLHERDHALLQLFMLEKATYEITYEAANRPDWLATPLRGLALIVETVLAGAETADA